MNFDSIEKRVYNDLYTKLDPVFVYHSCTHTRNVVKIAEEFARAEKLSEKAIILIKTAALLHDYGFLDDFRNHEESSAIHARKMLPSFGYTKKDIDIICNMILATKSPRVPKSLMEEVLCDADLDYLGRKDFYIHAFKYRMELENLDLDYTLQQWYEIQYKFLTCHKYFTKAAKNTRDKIRKEHIKEIAKLLRKEKKGNESREAI